MILIDGHNLIGRAGNLSLDEEEKSRELLLRRLAAFASGRGDNVAVVFDSERPGASKAGSFGSLKVIYASNRLTADGEILRRLNNGNPRATTVVTSDNALARQARALGAAVESVETFLNRKPKNKSSRRKDKSEKPSPESVDVEAWLRIFRAGK